MKNSGLLIRPPQPTDFIAGAETALFMMKIYLESIVRDIVVDVVGTADFQEIDNK